MAASLPSSSSLQRSISFKNPSEFARFTPGKKSRPSASPNLRAYDGFVRDSFHFARVPLFRGRGYYELCPLGVEPEPRELYQPPPPSDYLPMPFAPLGTFGPKPEFKTEIDYSTFTPRRSEKFSGAPFPRKRQQGDYNPIYTKRPEPIDKRRGDRDLERSIAEHRSWRVGFVPSAYPTSWEKAYAYDATRFQTFHKLLPFSSVDTYSNSNPRAHKAALMAATMRTSPDFWKYSFPNEYAPSGRLARLEYHFTHGYHRKNDHEIDE